MDVKIINSFLSAGLNVFQKMFSIESTNNEPYILQVDTGHQWEVSSILGVTGDFNGIVAFRLHKLLSMKMLELTGITDIEPDEREDMAKQLISEVINIVSGNAISAMANIDLKISPPVTISGRNHVISWPRNYPVIAIPFVTHYGPYEVDVCFK